MLNVFQYSEVAQSRPICDPVDCSPSGFSVHRILQARILEWVAISSSRGSSQPWDQTWVSCIDRWILYRLTHLGSPVYMYNWITLLCI